MEIHRLFITCTLLHARASSVLQQGPGSALATFIMAEARSMGMHLSSTQADTDLRLSVPGHAEMSKSKKFEGGLLLDPVTGIHTDIVVVDFDSLYPSLVQKYNLCPSTQTPNIGIESPNHFWFDPSRQGVLPKVMSFFKQKRNEATTPEENKTIKFLANMVYGLLATFTCSFRSISCASAIAAFGYVVFLLFL